MSEQLDQVCPHPALRGHLPPMGKALGNLEVLSYGKSEWP
nr:MAG TPA: hypothetical protein [Caudoviricetes sp.]